VTVEGIKKWIISLAPDFTHHLKTIQDFDQFQSSHHHPQTMIPKLYLISSSPLPFFNALSALYRNRLDLAWLTPELNFVITITTNTALVLETVQSEILVYKDTEFSLASVQ
jgi:hypothetical protein